MATQHPIDAFRNDILRGLRRRPKELSSKYLYDAVGSRLFEEICTLEEYYLTRTEIDLLRRHASEIASFLGPRVRLIELGAGTGLKTEILLRRLEDPVAYAPVDVSETALEDAARRLGRKYPHLEILPAKADFMASFRAREGSHKQTRDVVLFLGSTIGNLLPIRAARLLRSLRAARDRDSAFLIGADLKKDVLLLERAYNDRRGVTAEFNRNLLRRINRELEADFRPEAFRHRAFYDAVRGRIEMHLVSDSAQNVRIGGTRIRFNADESIRTEVSYKYALQEFVSLCRRAGLHVARVWTDEREWYGLYLCVPLPTTTRVAA